jgi:hypothetical protein
MIEEVNADSLQPYGGPPQGYPQQGYAQQGGVCYSFTKNRPMQLQLTLISVDDPQQRRTGGETIKKGRW